MHPYYFASSAHLFEVFQIIRVFEENVLYYYIKAFGYLKMFLHVGGPPPIEHWDSENLCLHFSSKRDQVLSRHM